LIFQNPNIALKCLARKKRFDVQDFCMLSSQTQINWDEQSGGGSVGAKEKWDSIGDFSGIVLSLDKALKYVDG